MWPGAGKRTGNAADWLSLWHRFGSDSQGTRLLLLVVEQHLWYLEHGGYLDSDVDHPSPKNFGPCGVMEWVGGGGSLGGPGGPPG